MERRLRREQGECLGLSNVRRFRHGFTLVELLICVAVIAILVSLIFPVIARAREQSRRVVCASNMRQLTLAAIRRGADEGSGIYVPTPDNDTDSFQTLYPNYVSDLRLFTCPSTDNQVNSPADLYNNAYGGRLGEQGHSFEIRAWTSGGVTFPDGTSFGQSTLKSYRRFKNQSRGCLLMDGDDATENDQNNWPDPTDNHTDEGLNIGFMDGHVEFTRPGRPLMEAYLEGYYDPSLPEDFYARYGVVHANNTFRYAY